MAFSYAAFSTFRFCTYIPYFVRSTIGLLSDSDSYSLFLLAPVRCAVKLINWATTKELSLAGNDVEY